MPRATAMPRAARLMPAAAVALLALTTAAVARGDGPRLDLVDACLDPESGRVELPLVLTGDEVLRPAGLRAVVAFDPSTLAPDTSPAPGTLPETPAVAPGATLGAAGVGLQARVDGEAGRIELLWLRGGRLPLGPLPAGEVARVRLRLRPGVAERPRVELMPGETGALDGNGRPAFVAVGPPVRPALPGSGPLLELRQGEGATLISARPEAGPASDGPPVLILRGSLEQARGLGRRVVLGPLQPLPPGPDGRVALDPDSPGAGRVFVYLAAAFDASGRTSLGFDSHCRPRRAAAGRAATR